MPSGFTFFLVHYLIYLIVSFVGASRVPGKLAIITVKINILLTIIFKGVSSSWCIVTMLKET